MSDVKRWTVRKNYAVDLVMETLLVDPNGLTVADCVTPGCAQELAIGMNAATDFLPAKKAFEQLMQDNDKLSQEKRKLIQALKIYHFGELDGKPVDSQTAVAYGCAALVAAGERGA